MYIIFYIFASLYDKTNLFLLYDGKIEAGYDSSKVKRANHGTKQSSTESCFVPTLHERSLRLETEHADRQGGV